MKLSRERKLLILAGFLVAGGGQGALINTFSVFIKPVTQALGFSRGEFTLYNSIIFLFSMLLLPLYGEIYRKKWFPRFLLLSAVICGLAPVGFPLCRSIEMFYFFAVLIGVFFNGVSINAVSTVITRWFGRNRGFATGICFSGSGLTAAVVLRLANSAIQRADWRYGYWTVSACSLLMMATGALIICSVERRGAPDAAHDPEFLPSQTETGKDDMTLRQACGTFGFWGIAASALLFSSITQSGGASIMAYASDLGYSSAAQSQIASASMFLLAAGKILFGRALDRWGVRFGFSMASAALAGYVLSLIFMPNSWAAAVAYVLFYGAAAPAPTVLVSYSVAAAYGKREYSRIYSLIYIGVHCGVMIGNTLPGLIYDQTGSYAHAWSLALFAALLAAALLACTYYDMRRRKTAKQAAL